jgi:hypothetical protein
LNRRFFTLEIIVLGHDIHFGVALIFLSYLERCEETLHTFDELH